MINTHDNVWIPSEGYKYISNDDIWATEIMLGAKDSIENWHDTNTEPPEPPTPEPKTEYEQGYDDSTYDSLEDEEV